MNIYRSMNIYRAIRKMRPGEGFNVIYDPQPGLQYEDMADICIVYHRSGGYVRYKDLRDGYHSDRSAEGYFRYQLMIEVLEPKPISEVLHTYVSVLFPQDVHSQDMFKLRFG